MMSWELILRVKLSLLATGVWLTGALLEAKLPTRFEKMRMIGMIRFIFPCDFGIGRSYPNIPKNEN
jgi:hypothetical protein